MAPQSLEILRVTRCCGNACLGLYLYGTVFCVWSAHGESCSGIGNCGGFGCYCSVLGGYYAAPSKTVAVTRTATHTQTVVKEVSRHEVKYPITIVDSAERTVTIEKEPQRVVVIASTQAMVLAALGAGG